MNPEESALVINPIGAPIYVISIGVIIFTIWGIHLILIKSRTPITLSRGNRRAVGSR